MRKGVKNCSDISTNKQNCEKQIQCLGVISFLHYEFYIMNCYNAPISNEKYLLCLARRLHLISAEMAVIYKKFIYYRMR